MTCHDRTRYDGAGRPARRPRARGRRADPPDQAGDRRAGPARAPGPAAGVLPDADLARPDGARCARRRWSRRSTSTRARSAARSSTSSTSAWSTARPDPDDGRATLVAVSDDAAAPARRRRRPPPQVARRAARRLVGQRARPSSSGCSAATTRRSTPDPVSAARRRCRAAAAVDRPAGQRAPRRRAARPGRSPQLSTTVTGAAPEGQHVGAGVEQLDLVARRRRERAAGRERRPVERQRRVGVALLGLDRERRPSRPAGGATAGRCPARSRTAGPCRTTGSAPGSRRGRPRRCGGRAGPGGPRRRRRPARGRAPRPGRGTPSRAARASSGGGPGAGEADRAAAVPGRVADDVVVAQHPGRRGVDRGERVQGAGDDVGERGRPTTARAARRS